MSLLRVGRVARLVSSRDERRTRPRALPPRSMVVGSSRVLAPIDPEGGGTWVGASERGLLVTLLNQSPPGWRVPARPLRSRGAIVLDALGHGSLARVEAMLRSLDVLAHAPLLLIATDGNHVLCARSDGRAMDASVRAWDGEGLVWSSSSLGDDVVTGPRARLFADLVRFSPSRATQDAFHAHQWQDATHASVRMERADARTVSVTTCTLAARSVAMKYLDLWESASASARVVRLSRLLDGSDDRARSAAQQAPIDAA